MRVSAHFQNPFNMHSWGFPDANISSPNVGKISGPIDGGYYNWNRQIFLVAKLEF